MKTIQEHESSCEAAAATALRLPGYQASEDDVLARLPVDDRPPELVHGARVPFAFGEHAEVLLGIAAGKVLVGNVGYQQFGDSYLSFWSMTDFEEAYKVLNAMAIVF